MYQVELFAALLPGFGMAMSAFEQGAFPAIQVTFPPLHILDCQLKFRDSETTGVFSSETVVCVWFLSV